MEYSISELTKIKELILNKIEREIDVAYRSNEIQSLLKKYDIHLNKDEEEPVLVDTKSMKILVLGRLIANKDELYKTAKSNGIDKEHIEFIDTYENKGFNVGRLKDSYKYSDIICGPNPHKQVGMEDYNSFLSAVEKNPNRYPKVIKAIVNGELKITKTRFRDALLSTRYYEAIQSE